MKRLVWETEIYVSKEKRGHASCKSYTRQKALKLKFALKSTISSAIAGQSSQTLI